VALRIEESPSSRRQPDSRLTESPTEPSAPPTEEALQKKERELGEAQRLARIGTWEWDPESDQVTWSSELFNILGLPPSEAPSFKQHAELFAPESYQRLEKAVLVALETGHPYELDLEVRSPAAPSRWIRGRGEAVRDKDGRIVRLQGTAQDITEKKRAEEALRESEERFRFATQAGHMFAYEWDVQSDQIVRSEQAVEILRNPNAVHTTGRASIARIHPDDQNKAIAAVRRLTPENPDYRMTIREIREDGEVVWLERTGHGFFDEAGNLVKLIGMAVDVTDRKRAEDVVRESEEKFRRVFRDAGIGMVVVSLDGHFLAANDAICECLGYSEPELQRKTMESLTVREDWPVLKKKMRGLVQKGVGFRRFQKRCIRKDGQLVHAEISANLIYDANGHPQCIVGEMLDISERKKAEQTLSTINGRLIEAQEQERIRIARELHDDITQRMALLAVELDELGRTSRSSSGKMLGKVRKLRREAEEIASDVQLISHRLHSSKLEHLGIVAAANSVCEEISRQQRVQVSFVHDKLPARIPHEISLSLFRVLQEAVHNAVKHSGAKHIEVRLAGGLGELELTVADSGCGFDPESASAQGGIGLLSMRERLNLVGGTLVVTSLPGVGTKVYARVALPEKTRKAKAAAAGR
jgi:PAS domain S-box-containing protein